MATAQSATKITNSFYNWFKGPELTKGLRDWKSRGKYFNFRGNDIFYMDVQGQGDEDSAFVAIHGYPTHSYDWRKMIPGLKSRYRRIIAPDMLGFGFSAKPIRYYKVMDQADMVEALLRNLGISKYHVITHDYSVSVGQELLTRHNEREANNDQSLQINYKFFTNGGLFPETHVQLEFMSKGQKPFTGTLHTYPLYYTGKIFALCDKVCGPNTAPTEEEKYEMWCAVRYNNGERIQQPLLTYMEQRRKTRDRWVGAMQKARIPLHLIYGELDPLSPPPYADHYRELVPQSGVTHLPDIGHWPNIEAPQSVNKIIFKCLDERQSNKP